MQLEQLGVRQRERELARQQAKSAELMAVRLNQLDLQYLFGKLKAPSVTACNWELKTLKIQTFGGKLYFHFYL